MEVVQGAAGGAQVLHLGAGVIALLLTAVAVCCLPSLMDYWRRWWVMKPIPGISPCYPLLGNALLLEREGEGKGSSRCSPAMSGCGCAVSGPADSSGCVCDACVCQSALCTCVTGCAARYAA
uniref:Uncharacterized protein n=1 Tax=Accipiter nisus TaxID=211598 RepID=A0A8B9NIQ1_9AVES